jgi:hypothetical protein
MLPTPSSSNLATTSIVTLVPSTMPLSFVRGDPLLLGFFRKRHRRPPFRLLLLRWSFLKKVVELHQQVLSY